MVQASRELERAVDAFLVASRALVGVAARSLAEVDEVTLPQFRALVILAAHPDTTVSDLAAALDIHPTSATRLTDRLVRKRLARRRESSDDRRVVHVRLSAAGTRLVDSVTARRRRELSTIVARMPPAHRAAAIESLASFAAAAGEPHVDLFGWEASAT